VQGISLSSSLLFSSLLSLSKDLSVLLDDDEASLSAIEQGLGGRPDPETLGILLINKAGILARRGDRDTAVTILGALALDPGSTLATEHLAKAALAGLIAGRADPS
jgi:hypothetical protein